MTAGSGPADRAGGVPGPIVLVGLSGAGKTVVGHLLARRLGWHFLDLDAEVERRAATSIAGIFAESGEQAFRDLEAEVTRAARPARNTVVSTGGGWMARPELRDSWPRAVRVWLQVEPAAAVARLADESSTRPLLADPDPVTELKEQLSSRAPAYRLAEVTVETDRMDPGAVAEAILHRIESEGMGHGT